MKEKEITESEYVKAEILAYGEYNDTGGTVGEEENWPPKYFLEKYRGHCDPSVHEIAMGWI